MLKNRLKNKKTIIFTSITLMIIFTLLFFVFSIIAIILNPIHRNIILGVGNTLCFIGFISFFILYLFSSDTLTKKWMIIFIAFSGIATLFMIIGLPMLSLCQNVANSVGMWFSIICSFVYVGISFGLLIQRTTYLLKNSNDYEFVLKDPED